jgi:hypothetical protein
LSPRRGDAPAETGVTRRREKVDVAAEDRLREQEVRLDAVAEPDEAEADATLRPLARALLALAEQLSQE